MIRVDRQKLLAKFRKSQDEPFSERPLAQSDPDSLIGVFFAAELHTVFDAEADEIPCRHDRLIFDFAEGSAGNFTPECPVQIFHRKNAEDFEGPYTVSFLYKGRLYQFGAKNNHDWYDVEAVQRALNFALKTAGQKERFLALEGDGQLASFIFADPDTFLPVAARYGLPLSDDPDAAMRKGKEYERRVIEMLQK